MKTASPDKNWRRLLYLALLLGWIEVFATLTSLLGSWNILQFTSEVVVLYLAFRQPLFSGIWRNLLLGVPLYPVMYLAAWAGCVLGGYLFDVIYLGRYEFYAELWFGPSKYMMFVEWMLRVVWPAYLCIVAVRMLLRHRASARSLEPGSAAL